MVVGAVTGGIMAEGGLFNLGVDLIWDDVRHWGSLLCYLHGWRDVGGWCWVELVTVPQFV